MQHLLATSAPTLTHRCKLLGLVVSLAACSPPAPPSAVPQVEVPKARADSGDVRTPSPSRQIEDPCAVPAIVDVASPWCDEDAHFVVRIRNGSDAPIFVPVDAEGDWAGLWNYDRILVTDESESLVGGTMWADDPGFYCDPSETHQLDPGDARAFPADVDVLPPLSVGARLSLRVHLGWRPTPRCPCPEPRAIQLELRVVSNVSDCWEVERSD